MIWQIIKKQGLTLLRNPQQLFLLLALPIILIAILGTALAGVMDDDTPNIDMKIGILEQEEEQVQVDRFLEELANTDFPEEAVEEIRANKAELAPVQMLTEEVLQQDALEEMMELHMVAPEEKTAVMKDDSYDALIEVPENFTYDALAFMLLDEPTQPKLHLYQNEGSEIGFSMLEDIVQQFQAELTIHAFIGQHDIDPSVLKLDKGNDSGEIIQADNQEPVSSRDYYAIGMAVMNVLFIASTIGSMAFLEKKMHVFDRIILANVSRWVYFVGILISTSIFAYLQLLIIYGFSWLVYGVQWTDVLSFMVVSVVYSVAIGAIGVMLTAISYRINTEAVMSLFGIVLVSIFAFIGGSFFPVGENSEVIQKIGDLTPNGAGMSAYLAILRGSELAAVSQHLYYLLLFAFVIILLAVIIFPKRGRTS